MRVDSTSLVPPLARGRDSVRIKSNAAYGDSVIIIDVSHIPYGCATWPAFWTKSSTGPWPHGGEIDIIEGNACISLLLRLDPFRGLCILITLTGNNLVEVNLETVHTTPNCTMEGAPRTESGYVQVSWKGCRNLSHSDFSFSSQDHCINQLRRQRQLQPRL